MALNQAQVARFQELKAQTAAQERSLTQQASTEIAARIEQIKVLLREIEEISNMVEMPVSLYEVISTAEDLQYNWQSSSYVC